MDGQWKRWSFASASRETDGVADVVSSSDDSLVLAVVGGCEGEDVAVAWGLTECSVKRFGVLRFAGFLLFVLVLFTIKVLDVLHIVIVHIMVCRNVSKHFKTNFRIAIKFYL